MDDQQWNSQPWQQHHQAPAPAYAPVHTPSAAPHPVPENDKNAAVVAWQWICYVLWEGALFALSAYLVTVLAYFMTGSSIWGNTFALYSLAALLVLLPASLVVDRIYSKREPQHKQGFAGVVMVLNIVLVSLAIASGVITAVFSLFSLLVSTEPFSSIAITVISSLVVSALGTMLFIRIMPPRRLQRLVKFFPLAVVSVFLLTTIFAIAGPLRTLIGSRADRLIEDNLTTLDVAIQNYVADKKALPDSLDDLSLDTSYDKGSKQLISRNLVSYEPGDVQPVNSANLDINNDFPTVDPYYGSGGIANYTLCVTFKKKLGTGKTDSANISSITSDHNSGRQCYDGQATIY